MTDILANQFSIDSSLDLAADAYTAAVAGSATYRAAADADTITLNVGLRDPLTDTDHTIGHLDGGIDEYEIRVSPDAIVGTIRGRDRMADLRDHPYQMRFLRAQPTAVEKLAMNGRTFDGLPNPILYSVGKWRASEIAKKVVEYCGLTLSWECRDYDVLENFDAAGRPLDIIRQLVAPWSQVEPLKVDVFVQGSTVICRPRSLTPTPDYTYTVKDARIKDLTIRRQRAVTYGRLTLSGMLNFKGKGIGSIVPVEVDETTEDESPMGEYGQPLTRVVRTTTYLVPPRIPIRIAEQTYLYDATTGAMPLVKHETTKNDWDPIQTTDVGVVNQPRLIHSLVKTEGIHPKDPDKRWRELSREETFYATGGMGITSSDMFGNNLTGWQSMTTTRKWECNIRRNTLEEKERVVRTWRECGNLQTQQVVDTYRPSGSTGAWARDPSSSSSSISAGVPPGGPRPDRTIMIGGTAVDPRDQLSREDWICPTESTSSADGVPMTVPVDLRAVDPPPYSNRSLKEEDLYFIWQQFVAASGLVPYEMLLTCVTMPWIRKGQVIQLTGLLAEDGTPIPLGPALVMEQHLTYDESSQSPSMLSTLRAVWWAA